jgi:hypothetical protein
LFLVGFVALTLPQGYLYHRTIQTWDPIPGAKANVYLDELGLGLLDDRFESVAVAPGVVGTVQSRDAVTKLWSAPSYADYLKLIEHYPLTMMGFYGRHLINGFDIHYSSVYTPAVRAGPDLLDLGSCLLVILGAARIAADIFRGRRFPVLPMLVLLIPCIVTVPVGIEPRFMLSGDALLYGSIVAPGARSLFRSVVSWHRGTAVIAIAAVVLAVCVWFAVMGSTLASTLYFP